MKYVDASAILRVVFSEPGPAVRAGADDRLVSSQVVEVETFRAIDRARLTGLLDDRETAVKRKELTDVLTRLDLVAVDTAVIDRAKAAFGVNVRSFDAIHVATAEIVAAEAAEDSLEFWTHDSRQAIAALARGLTVRGLSRESV